MPRHCVGLFRVFIHPQTWRLSKWHSHCQVWMHLSYIKMASHAVGDTFFFPFGGYNLFHGTSPPFLYRLHPTPNFWHHGPRAQRADFGRWNIWNVTWRFRHVDIFLTKNCDQRARDSTQILRLGGVRNHGVLGCFGWLSMTWFQFPDGYITSYCYLDTTWSFPPP